MKEAVAALPKYDFIIEQVNLGPFRFFHLDFLDSLWVFPKWVKIIISYTLETFWTLTRKLLDLKFGDIHSPSPQILGEPREHLTVES